MPTDDERREIAERLRNANENSCSPDCELRYALDGSYDCVGNGCTGCHLDVFERLADLIDPTCLARPDVEDTPDGGQFECWSCSVCGNIVSSDPSYDTDTDGPTYCEVCGHRIIGKGEPTWL